MSVDLSLTSVDLKEQYFSAAEASAIFPGRPSVPTIWRWMLHGVRGRRLRYVIVGGRRKIPLSAIEAWVQPGGNQPGLAMPTPKQRRKRIADAERRLSADGI